MGVMASQITILMIVYSTVYSGTDQRKHQSSVSLAFVRGIHWWPVNFPHKWPVTPNMFPFDDVIMVPFDDVIMVLVFTWSFLEICHNGTELVWHRSHAHSILVLHSKFAGARAPKTRKMAEDNNSDGYLRWCFTSIIVFALKTYSTKIWFN